MMTSNIRQSALWLVAAAAASVFSLAVVACSSDSTDDNPAPKPRVDAGGNPSTSPDGTGSGSDGGVDAAPVDPNCTSDASTCNSCVTPAADPYNACSPATGNCIPFDNAKRIPGWPNVPQVP